jgi:hypothetical protein
MSSVVKTVFGGSDDSAQKAQSRANKRTEELIAENTAQAREDVMGLFPAADKNVRRGFKAALNVFGDAVPQQISAFQQGNVGAQQALLAGLPQMQNALLGLPVDMSSLQAQQVQYDPSIFQQQLPKYVSSTKALNQNQGQSINQSNMPLLSGRWGRR